MESITHSSQINHSVTCSDSPDAVDTSRDANASPSSSTASQDETIDIINTDQADFGELKPKGRGRAFSLNEDYLICRAWILASTDPIVGVGQKAETFHASAAARYSTLSSQAQHFNSSDGKMDARRTPKSIKNRWDTIRKTTNVVHCVQDRKPMSSGENEEKWKGRILPLIKKDLSNTGSVIHPRNFPAYFKITDYLRSQAKFTGRLMASSDPVGYKHGVKKEKRPIGRRAAARQVKAAHLAEAVKSTQGPLTAGADAIKNAVEEYQRSVREAVATMKKSRDEQRKRDEEREMRAELRHQQSQNQIMAMLQIIALPEHNRGSVLKKLLTRNNDISHDK